ncbi:MAG TPA: STAS domain-containing protein [Rubrivivax sp.]|nr:STAS domain-containing protein [Rubrivivax sp.]
MPKQENLVIGQVLRAQRDKLIREWTAEATKVGSGQRLSTGAVALNAEAGELVDNFEAGIAADGDADGFGGPAWQKLRDTLESISQSGAARGATAAETSAFVMAFKRPLFSALQQQLSGDPASLAATLWAISTLVDKMAEVTLGAYQRSREEIIKRQQEELLELSTPVVKLWEGVLAVPMIGTLDSSRTQLVMESLLQRIVDTGSEMAIIDITGVPTVDTLVAQHLLKTVTAIRLMGADCIISGVRPQIAQTIVHLGIDLRGIITKASLADALALAMSKAGYVVARPQAR